MFKQDKIPMRIFDLFQSSQHLSPVGQPVFYISQLFPQEMSLKYANMYTHLLLSPAFTKNK